MDCKVCLLIHRYLRMECKYLEQKRFRADSMIDIAHEDDSPRFTLEAMADLPLLPDDVLLCIMKYLGPVELHNLGKYVFVVLSFFCITDERNPEFFGALKCLDTICVFLCSCFVKLFLFLFTLNNCKEYIMDLIEPLFICFDSIIFYKTLYTAFNVR